MMDFSAAAAELVARLEALQRRVDALEAREQPRAVREALVTGEGYARRITPAGEAYVQRRIIEGATNAQIARELGVSPSQIAKRRPRH